MIQGIFLAAQVGEVLTRELGKIANQYVVLAIIFVACLMILAVIIRGIKALFRLIFKR